MWHVQHKGNNTVSICGISFVLWNSSSLNLKWKLINFQICGSRILIVIEECNVKVLNQLALMILICHLKDFRATWKTVNNEWKLQFYRKHAQRYTITRKKMQHLENFTSLMTNQWYLTVNYTSRGSFLVKQPQTCLALAQETLFSDCLSNAC